MNHDLRSFLYLMMRAVLPALLLVAVTAFATIPYLLGHHPGEPATTSQPVAARHMT